MKHFMTINDSETGLELVERESILRIIIGDVIYLPESYEINQRLRDKYFARGMRSKVVNVDIFIDEDSIRQLVSVIPLH